VDKLTLCQVIEVSRAPDLVRRTELASRAFEVLRARGVRTSMSELAEALGIKRPTLYFYFKDTGAVLETVLEETQRSYFAHVTGKVAGIAHPIDQLAAVMRVTIEFHQSRRDRVMLLFQLWTVSGDDPGRILAKNRELTDPMRAIAVRQIEAGVADGRIAPCDPQRLVDLALAVLDGAMVHEVHGGSALPIVDEFERRVLAPLRRATPRRKKPARRRTS
jgi:AcrR family transcriptional regulator